MSNSRPDATTAQEDSSPLSELRTRYFEEFAAMEWRPFASLLEHWALRTELLVRFVRESVPDLSQRVSVLFEGEEFQPWRWGELPILTRAELQRLNTAFLQIEPPPDMGPVSQWSTSGSTGQPVKVRHTALSRVVVRSMQERLFHWHGFDPNARLATISADGRDCSWPDGKIRGPWTSRGPGGTGCVLTIFATVDQQLDWLERMRPRYLSTVATNLHELAEYALQTNRGIEIEAIIAGGTALLPHTREMAAEAFGARVIETYACEEIGLIAIQCPQSSLLHICPEHVMVEVIDEADEPVEPGRGGRVLLTNLFNYAMPLLRYEVGDIVETAGETCLCGRTLPALRRVVGRIRRPLEFADGVRVRPHAAVIAAGVPDLLPAKQFQIVQVAIDCFEIRYVPQNAMDQPDTENIRRRFREMVHPSVDVRLVPVTEIARGPRGKYQDFIYFDS